MAALSLPQPHTFALAGDDRVRTSLGALRVRVVGRGAEIRCPATVIGGTLDPVFPPRESEALANGIRDAHLVLLDATAHTAPLEPPQRVLDELRSHLW